MLKKTNNYELVSPFVRKLQARIKDPSLLKKVIDKIYDNKKITISDNEIVVYKKERPIFYLSILEDEIILIDYLVKIKHHFYFEKDITHITINHENLNEYLLFKGNRLVERRLCGTYNKTKVYRIEHYDGDKMYVCRFKNDGNCETTYYQVNHGSEVNIYNINTLGYVFVNKIFLDYKTYQLKKKGELN